VLLNSENDNDPKYPSASFIAQQIGERIFNIPKTVVKDLPVPKEEIEKYLGDWAANPNVTIFQTNNQIWAKRTGASDSMRLFYQGDHKFIPDNNHSVILDFQFENGQTNLFNVNMNGNVIATGRRKK
jgi:hypothetical protein